MSNAPKVIVKKEPPSSPEIQPSRHRPRKLDLTTNVPIQGALTGRPSGPLTAKESGGLAMHDVGLACLSPGLHTLDPTMREQLQRSIDVRDRQRQIIEARQKTAKGDPSDAHRGHDPNTAKTPQTSRRKGPPPGLSIAPPSHNIFANERVIQSAPLNQSFTGLRHHQQPLSRQIVNQPSGLSHTSHIHHVPATQTLNRLPPIADVFAGEGLGHPREPSRNGLHSHSPGHSSHSNHPPPLPSPGFANNHVQPAPQTSRPREYKSAEDAVQSLSGGREDLLPRIVHYGGHQPPTPPSPMATKNGGHHSHQHGQTVDVHRSGNANGSRRRGRDEYERDNGSPPLGGGRIENRRGPFGAGRDSPETSQKKKEEFITLCERAWDLFHS